DQIALTLLELDRIQNYKHNPTFYVELLGGALFQPLTDDFAPEEVRLGDILSRIAASPHFLDQARSQLVDADPIFIKVAIEENELKKTRAEMLQIALPLHKQYFPDHDDHASLSAQERENKVIGEVLQRISDDHPKRDDLVQTVKDDLASIRQFIIDKKIVSLKSRDNLKVIPTPPFMRGIYSVAGFHSAPPLDPN